MALTALTLRAGRAFSEVPYAQLPPAKEALSRLDCAFSRLGMPPHSRGLRGVPTALEARAVGTAPSPPIMNPLIPLFKVVKCQWREATGRFRKGQARAVLPGVPGRAVCCQVIQGNTHRPWPFELLSWLPDNFRALS